MEKIIFLSPEVDFEIFKDVVANAYRFSDLMLGRLMQLAGEEATVILCSDHGFMSGEFRPMGNPKEPAGPAIWHRRYGIFLMQGPGIKRDERIYGASLIDVAPTILVAAGMPVAKDMDGRPLLEVFERPPEVEVIDSWEKVSGDFESGMHTEEKPLDPAEAEELVQQFAALGYIEDPVEDKDKQFISAEMECMYNLARNYMFVGKPLEAVPLLEELVRRSPWESRFIVQLIQACQKAGLRLQAIELIESAFVLESTKHTLIPIIWAEMQLSLGTAKEQQILEILGRTENLRNANPILLKRVGQIFVKMRRWPDAERVYLKALTINRDDAEVWQGLSRTLARMGRYQESIDAAFEAVGLVHRLPHAHLQLGIGLAKTGDPERAVVALETALQFSPGFVPAHRWLATVYRSQLGNPQKAKEHTDLARQYKTSQDTQTGKLGEADYRSLDVPELPEESERERLLNEERPDRLDPRKPSGKTFVIVSGLPRSGTSLMMQMLDAGGLPPKTDTQRVADEDNPKGYYEWEDIKRVKGKPTMLLEDGLEGKAIKAVTMVLQDLPFAHNYKVIFMNRPIEEVVASQTKMLERVGTQATEDESRDLMRKEMLRHRMQARRRVEANPRVEVLDIDYPSLIANPVETSQLVAEFLGSDRITNPEAMSAVVDPSLYRQKKS
ncbi:MAG: tetratricopeptide repeat protein [Pirellulaceae bacterium]|nr:tetratricopeptide repeat protein [Pirellulaceae bacterium]